MNIEVEPFISCWGEVFSLTNRHFQELGKPYHPDYQRYREYWDCGNLFVVTVRDEMKLVGFAMMYVFRSMHDQGLGAQEDLFYLLPEYRKGWTAAKLLREVESECERRGCLEVGMMAIPDSAAGVVLLSRGYAITHGSFRKSLLRADSPDPQSRGCQ